MGKMFDLYPQPSDYVPNNRPRHCKPWGLNIMTGETSSHTFEIPFDVETECTDVKVIYKVGLEVVLVKDFEDLHITLEDKEIEIAGEIEHIIRSFITDEVSPEETLLFGNTLLDSSVQLKFSMKTGETTYREIYRVVVVDSLDNGSK